MAVGGPARWLGGTRELAAEAWGLMESWTDRTISPGVLSPVCCGTPPHMYTRTRTHNSCSPHRKMSLHKAVYQCIPVCFKRSNITNLLGIAFFCPFQRSWKFFFDNFIALVVTNQNCLSSVLCVCVALACRFFFFFGLILILTVP